MPSRLIMLRQIVFRSARTGHKNLWLMDARGEEYGLHQLTDGPWTDSMPAVRTGFACSMLGVVHESTILGRPPCCIHLF